MNRCFYCNEPADVSVRGADGQVGHYCESCYAKLPVSHVHSWRNVRHVGAQQPPHQLMMTALIVSVIMLLALTLA